MSPQSIGCNLNPDRTSLPNHVRFNCCLDAAMSVIEGRWKGTILCMLYLNGGMRFSELQKAIGEVSSRILSKQLRELEADGLISRRVYPVVPPRTEYSLTELGLSLMPVIEHMCSWGISYMDAHGMAVADCARGRQASGP